MAWPLINNKTKNIANFRQIRDGIQDFDILSICLFLSLKLEVV